MGPISLLLLVSVFIISSNGEALFDACNKDDLKCLSGSTEMYLSKTRLGNAEYGIKAIDPFTVAELEVVNDDKVHLQYVRNVVSGFSNLKITAFQLNMTNPHVVLKMKVDFTVESIAKFQLKKENKLFSGPLKATATAYTTTQYGLSFKEVNGKTHFVLGPETTIVEIRQDPALTLDKEFEKQMSEDPDITKMKTNAGDKRSVYLVQPLIKLAEAGFVNIIHNLRVAATLFPKENFFKDL